MMKHKQRWIVGALLSALILLVATFREKPPRVAPVRPAAIRPLVSSDHSKPSFVFAMPETAIPPAPLPSTPIARAHERLQHQAAANAAKPHHALPDTVPAAPRQSTHRARIEHPFGLQTVPVVPDELLITGRKGVFTEEMREILSRYDLETEPAANDLLRKLGFERCKTKRTGALVDLIAALQSETDDWVVEANPIITAFDAGLDDPMLSTQWNLNQVLARDAWQVLPHAPPITVAVIDSGVDLEHPDLKQNLIPGYDFVAKDTPPDDEHGHGTLVAGVIGAGVKNGIGIAGIARGCRLLPVRVLDENAEGDAATVAAGIVYAVDNGAKVINLSLGTYYKSTLLEAAVEYAADKGCTLVAAMGGNGLGEPAYPAAYPEVVAVGALAPDGQPAHFSNAADCIDLAAPGQGVLSTELGGGYARFTGTSAASAHVAGAAAMVRAVRPDFSGSQVENSLMLGATDIGDAGWYPGSGFGIINCLGALQTTDTAMPPVSVVDVVILPVMPLPGQRVSVYIRVRNHSSRAVTNIGVALNMAGAVVDTAGIPTLAGKSVSDLILTATIPDTLLSGDILEGRVAVSTLPHPPDDKSARTFLVHITNERLLDVGIDDISVQGAPLSMNHSPLPIRLTIANRGNTAMRQGILELQYPKGQPVAEHVIHSLEPGARDTIVLLWHAPGEEQIAQGMTPLYTIHATLTATGEDANEIYTANRHLSFARIRDNTDRVIAFHTVSVAAETHQWIAKQGYEYFMSQVEGADIADYIGTIEGSFTADDNDFIEGTYAEDQSNRAPLYQTYPFFNHFVAGADGDEIRDGWGSDILGYNSALEQAEELWPFAVAEYQTDRGKAFCFLGHVAHLVGDMTVPAHTHNDGHPTGDTYEDTIGLNENFKLWFFGGGRAGHWDEPLSLHDDLHMLFYRTANYTEDYDSDDVSGDAPPYYSPPDYPDTDHAPEAVDRADGISLSEVLLIGDDLMPYAMRRTADLIRLYYSQVDTSDPVVAVTYPGSNDVSVPTCRATTSAVELTADASDPESGILKQGYQFMWRSWTGAEWSQWQEVTDLPTGPTVSFVPPDANTLYAFCAWAENGGGRLAVSPVTYLFVDSTPPEAPAITGFSDTSQSNLILSGQAYTHNAPHFKFTATDVGSGISGYYIYWGPSPTGSTTFWTSRQDYTSPALQEPLTYYLHVRARDKAGNLGPAATFVYEYRLEKTALTVTAQDAGREYGDENPEFTLVYTGFLEGDDTHDLDLPPAATSVADRDSQAGTFEIVPTGGWDGAYTFEYVNGTLTIDPAPLRCRADDKSKTFGSTNPPLTLSYTGLKNEDTAPAVPPTIACLAEQSSPPGTYPITISGGTDANYELTLSPATLTVLEEKGMQLWVKNGDQIYELEFGELTAATNGFDRNLDVPNNTVTSGAFNAMFLPPGTDTTVLGLLRDYRAPAETSRWVLIISGLSQTDTAAVMWQTEPVANGRELYLQRLEDEQAVGFPIDMLTETEVEITGSAVLEITYAPSETAALALSPGWNLIGTPLMSQVSAADITGGNSGVHDGMTPLYTWENGRYRRLEADAALTTERAYWFYAATAASGTQITGVRADGIILLRPGWNLLSPVRDGAAPVADGISDLIWTWQPENGRYDVLAPGENLRAGHGYWIFLDSNQPQAVSLGQ